jgi:hypothetical protein
MRIAVCFRGQIRTGVEASKKLIHYFGPYFKDMDFFVHTWDNTTCPALGGPDAIGGWNADNPLDRTDEGVNRALEYLENKKKSMEVVYGLYQSKLDMDYFDKFLKIYNPINYEVESYSEFLDKAEGGVPGDPAFPQWYSLYKSVKMKKEYEEQNNFIYDIVIAMRPDIIFHPNVLFKKQIEWYLKQPNNTLVVQDLDTSRPNWREENDEWGEDVYYHSNSNLMDKASLFGDLEYNLERSNLYFFNHLDKIGANITTNSPYSNGYAILRDWTLGHDSIFDPFTRRGVKYNKEILYDINREINEYEYINRIDNIICNYNTADEIKEEL